jgi:hypothetical protein
MLKTIFEFPERALIAHEIFETRDLWHQDAYNEEQRKSNAGESNATYEVRTQRNMFIVKARQRGGADERCEGKPQNRSNPFRSCTSLVSRIGPSPLEIGKGRIRV